MGGEEATEFVSTQTGEPFPTAWGPTARIVMVAPDGAQTEVAALPSILSAETETTGGARLALLDGALYATTGGWVGGVEVEPPALMGAVVRVEDGNVTEVANTWAFEDANNPDGLILESHPYGITAGPDGWLWVADAGGNTLLRIDPEAGVIEVVATFGALPGAFPNPNRNGAVEADPVPTAVAFDDAGNAYVSFLSGAPFIPGSAKVVMVTPEGEVSDYAVGLTMLTDLQRGPDGELYAVQFGMFTQEGPVPNAGAIVRVREGDASEVVVGGLPFPTAIAFDDAGNAFVTVNGVGTPGSGAVARFDALTQMAGEPIMIGE
ncbi:MAG: ScyD/ScyE family protein [Anaerolineae bacterium]|nr:ScyD/ScyE family protein [Anaerolineae bacterium]